MHVLARAIALAALVALAPLASFADATITVSHDKLDPGAVKIAKGESVTFHNVAEMPGGHTIAADDGSFQSPPLKLDESYTQKFEKSGAVKVHIVQHPNVTAVITVQ